MHEFGDEPESCACGLHERQVVLVVPLHVKQVVLQARQLSALPVYPVLHLQVAGAVPVSDAFSLHTVHPAEVPVVHSLQRTEQSAHAAAVVFG